MECFLLKRLRTMSGKGYPVMGNRFYVLQTNLERRLAFRSRFEMGEEKSGLPTSFLLGQSFRQPERNRHQQMWSTSLVTTVGEPNLWLIVS